MVSNISSGWLVEDPDSLWVSRSSSSGSLCCIQGAETLVNGCFNEMIAVDSKADKCRVTLEAQLNYIG